MKLALNQSSYNLYRIMRIVCKHDLLQKKFSNLRLRNHIMDFEVLTNSLTKSKKKGSPPLSHKKPSITRE